MGNIMNCPKCKHTQLAKKGPNSPFSCIKCKGVWLKTNEAEELHEQYESISDSSSPYGYNHDSRTGLCPEGHGILVRAEVSADKPFHLEKCMRCAGIWFDQGEIKTLIEDNLLGYLTEFWTTPWRRKQTKEQNRMSFLQLNEELLGTEVYRLTLELANKIKKHPERSRVFDLLRHELSI